MDNLLHKGALGTQAHVVCIIFSSSALDALFVKEAVYFLPVNEKNNYTVK